jgi:hypothetical protein
MTESFRWMSPLGASVALFLAIGILWLLIGALTVPLHDKGAGFVSPATDTAFFGKNPSDLLASDPAFRKLRTLLLTVIAGFLLLSGSLFVSLAWFGLKAGFAWALPALSIGCLLAIALWALALLPYFRAGIPVTVGDLPPFMWVPAALIVPATVLGWIGLS